MHRWKGGGGGSTLQHGNNALGDGKSGLRHLNARMVGRRCRRCGGRSLDFGLDLGMELGNIVADVEGTVLQQAGADDVEGGVEDTGAVIGSKLRRVHGGRHWGGIESARGGE